jgi:hypothetical protein
MNCNFACGATLASNKQAERKKKKCKMQEEAIWLMSEVQQQEVRNFLVASRYYLE